MAISVLKQALEIEELVGDFHYVIHPTINHIYDPLRGIKHKLRG